MVCDPAQLGKPTGEGAGKTRVLEAEELWQLARLVAGEERFRELALGDSRKNSYPKRTGRA